VTSQALIVDAVRSPIGRKNGALSKLRGDELAGQVMNALVDRVGLDPGEVEDVQMGCVTQIGEQGWKIGSAARRCRPISTPLPPSGPGSSTSSSRPASR
jgi:acetyl-CoA acetyltransferase